MNGPRHFVDIDAVDGPTLRRILDAARSLKAARGSAGKAVVDASRPLDGKLLAMIFEQPSTRTRLSFDVAMRQLGGQTISINGRDMQLGRGETMADTARVLSRYVDAIVIRTSKQQVLDEMVAHATVPVINGLTDTTHPCQVMADVMTFEEHCGPIAGRVVAWSGDGNNVANSWIHGAVQFGYELRLACPPERRPMQRALDWAKARGATVRVTSKPEEAVRQADCVVTDAWVSMHDDARAERHNLLAPYQVNRRLMALARSNALFMHCLPAHRGEEVTAEVIDGPQSVVWDQAENRLHAQKGILAWCLG
ncbi:MAG: ornithine carbamoyltransferase [Alphaproteobacteria bacterium]|nr:ornithine carbamoyltransferase [Alphaproteobacteria bacterium]